MDRTASAWGIEGRELRRAKPPTDWLITQNETKFQKPADFPSRGIANLGKFYKLHGTYYKPV